MQLSKSISARTKTIMFQWVRRDFSVMGPKWRAVRAKMRTKLDHCGWCKRAFNDGDTIGLGCPKSGKNIVLCDTCCTKAGAP